MVAQLGQSFAPQLVELADGQMNGSSKSGRDHLVCSATRFLQLLHDSVR